METTNEHLWPSLRGTSKQCDMLCKVIEKKYRKSPTTKRSLRRAVSKIVVHRVSRGLYVVSFAASCFTNLGRYILNFPFFQYLLVLWSVCV